MELVRFKPEYLEPMLALHRSARLALEGLGLDVGITEEEEAADLNAIERVYLDGGGEFLIGLLDGAVMAMGGFQRLSERSAELRRMRIRTDLQGKGYGSRLLAELERLALQSGIDVFTFETAKARVRAMEFRAVEERDQTRQALLEIYCAIALQTPYNNFGNH